MTTYHIKLIFIELKNCQESHTASERISHITMSLTK